jgi:hypothetical protein
VNHISSLARLAEKCSEKANGTVAAVYDRRYFVDSGKTGAHRAPLQLEEFYLCLVPGFREWKERSPWDGCEKRDLRMVRIVLEPLEGSENEIQRQQPETG